jgi:ABC-type transport system involved in multi-copper enzyme maturation permease subunit
MRITVARRNFRGLGHFEKGEGMNALVKKEIRLLLPGWLAILLLEVLQPWLWREPDYTFSIAPVIFFFGMIIFAVDSFGREFSLGTFQSLLSQPIERRQIWRTKIMVLFSAAVLIFAAYFASCELRLHQGLKILIWHVNPTIIGSDFRNAMTASGALLVVALTGGLWTALLLRQIASAFWITFLTPAMLLMAIAIIMSKFFNSASDVVVFSVLYVAAMIYCVAGFWLAHRLFHRSQDVAWTGGVISFSKWRYFEAASNSFVSVRRRKPIAALLKKEFQLHSITLFFAGALLVLHLGVFFLIRFYAIDHKNSFADGVSMFFWTLWLVLPLTLGCMTVAEERKLDVTEGQFCLPASRRLQFFIKFIPAMVFGVLLGGVMPVLLEGLAAHFGAPNDFFKPDNNNGGFMPGITGFQISIVGAAAGLSLAAFFASTLAKNFLQALSIAIVIVVGCWILASFIVSIGEHTDSFFGLAPKQLALTVLIAIPTMMVMYLWLVYRNFSYFHEAGRLWRRNILGIIGALLFVLVSSAVIYNRAWEIFEPAEPPHGAAKFSLANPPKLNNEYDDLLVHLPDGRVWFDGLGTSVYENHLGTLKMWWRMFVDPLPKSVGPQQFLSGSNWMSVTARRSHSTGGGSSETDHVGGFLDTVGIQSNGTLWISSRAAPEIWTGSKMVQFGDETNWQQVIRSYGASFGSFLLLKNNGTLWRWGTTNYNWSQWRTNWPNARTFTPRQIGTNSDWKEIGGTWNNLAKKSDGSIWSVNMYDKSRNEELHQDTNLDQVSLKTLSLSGNGERAYVRADGTLWMSWMNERNGKYGDSDFVRVGMETNWTTVSMTGAQMMALKSDGSLWKWPFPKNSIVEIVKIQPARMGINNDWVGLSGTWGGFISLAADGSLWLWPDPNFYYELALLKAPKQPQLLGNIFGKSD